MDDTMAHPMEDPEYANMVGEAIADLQPEEMVYLLAAWAWLCPGSFKEGLARLPEFV
jgi:hypothetical protein